MPSNQCELICEKPAHCVESSVVCPQPPCGECPKPYTSTLSYIYIYIYIYEYIYARITQSRAEHTKCATTHPCSDKDAESDTQPAVTVDNVRDTLAEDDGIEKPILVQENSLQDPNRGATEKAISMQENSFADPTLGDPNLANPNRGEPEQAVIIQENSLADPNRGHDAITRGMWAQSRTNRKPALRGTLNTQFQLGNVQDVNGLPDTLPVRVASGSVFPDNSPTSQTAGVSTMSIPVPVHLTSGSVTSITCSTPPCDTSSQTVSGGSIPVPVRVASRSAITAPSRTAGLSTMSIPVPVHFTSGSVNSIKCSTPPCSFSSPYPSVPRFSVRGRMRGSQLAGTKRLVQYKVLMHIYVETYLCTHLFTCLYAYAMCSQ